MCQILVGAHHSFMVCMGFALRLNRDPNVMSLYGVLYCRCLCLFSSMPSDMDDWLAINSVRMHSHAVWNRVPAVLDLSILKCVIRIIDYTIYGCWILLTRFRNKDQLSSQNCDWWNGCRTIVIIKIIHNENWEMEENRMTPSEYLLIQKKKDDAMMRKYKC